ncbi:MAG TPA: lysylphosphatidylglycerol synthase transmembrane domain-containing protein [Gemmatimonadales bacterium]|nr:lysylphosphatidylglycerol synthase transmembrane domain-containing protein [Gemmatimonadales bacterium]
MSPEIKKTLTRVLTVAGAIGLLLLIFRVVPFADVMRSIRSAEPTKLAIGFVLLFVARVVAAWRMKLLTDEQDLRLSLPEIFEIGTTSTFYGLILPGTLSGGLIRWYKLARQGNAVGALASLTWDRLADTVAVAILGVAAWALSRPTGAHALVGPGLLGVTVALVALYLAGFSELVGNVVLRPIDAAARRLRAGWLRSKLEAVGVAARSYHGLGAVFPTKVGLWSLAVQLVGSVGFYVWAQALGSPVGLAEVTWARACYTLVLLLPITFAGLGAREGVLILLLQPYGVTGADAVALSFIQLAGTLILAILGGLYEFRTFWRRRVEPEPVAIPAEPPLVGSAGEPEQRPSARP